MHFTSLFQEISATKIVGNTDIELTGICYDSRKVKPGDVFVCVVGFETDGHKYIDAALAKGARAVVVQNGAEIPDILKEVTAIYTDDTRSALASLAATFYGHPERKLKIIGVTGTNGKTTVTTLIKSVLEFEGKMVGLIGTNANMIGARVLPTERTTPESLELFQLFSEMLEEGVEYVVMEVSSHSLELQRVHGIFFAVGAFTNLTQDHLDFHKTMENYFLAKKKLFSVSQTGVVNIDDAAGRRLLEETTCPMASISVDGDASFSAKNIRISARGVVFELTYEKKKYTVRLGIPGKFSVYNALTALASLVGAGIDIERAIEGLTFAQGVMGRCETVYTGTDYSVIIDYAHTPDGLENIISTVKEFAEGRVVTLFGCGGDRDKTKRPQMGEIAARLSDFVIVTSDNPRTEKPGAIIEDIMVGVLKTPCEYVVIENRREAIFYALKNAKPGDCIILAGKGHETYQIIGKEKRHFDEREVVQEALLAIRNEV